MSLRANQRCPTLWVIAIPRGDWSSFCLPRRTLGLFARFPVQCFLLPARARIEGIALQPLLFRRRSPSLFRSAHFPSDTYLFRFVFQTRRLSVRY